MVGRKKEPKPLGPWKRNHPTVSFRVSRADRERLDEMVRREGKPLGELLHYGLGLARKQLVNERRKYAQGYAEGHKSGLDLGMRAGFAQGFGRFDLPCRRCGRPVRFDIRILEQKAVLDKALPNVQHQGDRCPGGAANSAAMPPHDPWDLFSTSGQ